MIVITNKKDCCGCNACVQICPKHCITMRLEEEGFYYPFVDEKKCIDCGLCEKVCPVINLGEERLPSSCIAAIGKNLDIVEKSSSAGLFYLIGEKIIKNGGIVFGVIFNKNWDVVHSYADTVEGLKQMLGSKYVQSSIGNSFQQAEGFLKSGREVLFSGTPCQISGLRRFLRKDYPNLLCVDVVCHGTPSPGVWREYLKYLISPKRRKNSVLSSIYSSISEEDAMKIHGISFRNKRLGWRKFSFVLLASQGFVRSEENTVSPSYKTIINQKHYFNVYMRAFLNNFTLRYSCFACPARKGRSGSDIMLGDYWGVMRYYPEFSNKNGVSMALAYTTKGEVILKDIDIDRIVVKYEETLDNSNIENDVPIPKERFFFFQDFRKDRVKSMESYCKVKRISLFLLAIRLLKNRIKKVLK